jgi:hypothetical protein
MKDFSLLFWLSAFFAILGMISSKEFDIIIWAILFVGAMIVTKLERTVQ